MIREILAYVFDTEEEAVDKIAAIDESKGYPNAGADTYCSYEFNNTKWIVKYSPNIGMNIVFGYEPIEFDYTESVI
jgi:hypothetical protein